MALARKLSVIMHAIWKDDTEFEAKGPKIKREPRHTAPAKVAVPTTAAGNRQNPSDLHASPTHREYYLRDVDALDTEMKHQME